MEDPHGRATLCRLLLVVSLMFRVYGDMNLSFLQDTFHSSLLP